MDLPDGTTDPRSGETALAVALGGAICPVPFVMSIAALRIAAPRRTRRARAAFWLAATTIALQALGLTVLAVVLAT
jgi:cytochrome bd-type quinol oxidase subunit 1